MPRVDATHFPQHIAPMPNRNGIDSWQNLDVIELSAVSFERPDKLTAEMLIRIR